MDDYLYGALSTLPSGVIAATALVALATPVFLAWPMWSFTAIVLLGLWLSGAGAWWWAVTTPILLILTLPWLRRPLLSSRILRALRRAGFMPQISATEREAIAAGTVWLDAELFSGRPDLAKIASAPYPDLDDRERDFLDGPTAEACARTDDWRAWREGDLPEEVWSFLRSKGFFGLVIPREYGGLGMSASANSAVVARLASHSLPLAITVMVPNSLGPGELLTHYGTEEQKRRWLPALASGEEIPCFALTEPSAGSDATAIQATGTVFRDEDGVLRLRLNWDKRYITLAAVATVLGLAFRLRDPDNLLGKGPTPGITCALIPASTPGVVLGRRHDPLGVPFYNCPTSGRDVVVDLEEAVIGGLGGVGQGWQMLMESLAAGRGISLPATATGGAQLVARAVSAYAGVRQQFGLPISRFEGIEEPMARIASAAYLLEATRRFVCGALDGGEKPAVVTAIAKYNTTELWRQVINDGMDVCGGAAISRGPRNLLAHSYAGTPICITVEGANILTRTLMIFGQGAIRCHPFAFAELDAIQSGNTRAFDRTFWPHLGHVLSSGLRTVLLGLTRGHLGGRPPGGPTAKHWRRIRWASAEFAFLADLAMGTLGGNLKRREKLTGRFADWFSWMFLGCAALRRFEAEGRRAEDLPLVDHVLEDAFRRMQEARCGIYDNLRLPVLGRALRFTAGVIARLVPFGRGPTDAAGHRVARTVATPGSQRDRLTSAIWLPDDPSTALGRLEKALRLCTDAEPVTKKLKAAVRQGRLPKAPPAELLEQALGGEILTEAEADLVRAAEAARADAIAVDSFTLEEYARAATAQGSLHAT